MQATDIPLKVCKKLHNIKHVEYILSAQMSSATKGHLAQIIFI